MEKNGIKICPELFPNVVLHVLACAQAGFNQEYGARFRSTLTNDEIIHIQIMSNQFRVERPAISGPLFRTLFQVPCYFPVETVEDINTVYELTANAVKEKSFTPFAQDFPDEVECIYNEIPPACEELFFQGNTIKKPHIVNFGTIVQDVYTRFYREYWPAAQKKMEIPATEILGLLNVNVVHQWEKITELKFPYPRLHVVLAEATTFLGTSLLAEKGVFSIHSPVSVIADMVVHEVGTHIMLQEQLFFHSQVIDILTADYNNFVRVIEAACHILRQSILATMELPSQADIITSMGLEKEAREFIKIWPHTDIIDALIKTYQNVYT
jgi:hypothetical protein